MRRITLAIIAGVIMAPSLLAQPRRTCDTTYAGPVDGNWTVSAYWTSGIPGAGELACFVSEAAARSIGLPESIATRITPRSRITHRQSAPVTIALVHPAQRHVHLGGGPSASSGVIEPQIVYSNLIDLSPAFAIRIPGAGVPMAEDIVLSTPGFCLVTSYEFAVIGLGDSGPTFDVQAQLWDGNPCDGASSAIAGTDVTAAGLPNNGSTVSFVQFEIPGPVIIPQSVWLSLTFSTDDAGWVVAEEAELGFTGDFWSEEDEDFGCILQAFADLYGGFWSKVSCAAESAPPSVCCVQSECVIADFFDCRELGGYRRPTELMCNAGSCSSGACCKDDLTCRDDDGLGGSMDEGLCELIGGTYVGGAACDDTDPCQPYRIPQGYEIVKLSPGLEDSNHLRPQMNDCGEVVFSIGTGIGAFEEAEIYHYDNGRLTKLTDNKLDDVYPDINYGGTMVWYRDLSDDEWQTQVLRDGNAAALDPSLDPAFVVATPRINKPGEIVWSIRISHSCPAPTRDVIYHYDGFDVELLFDDELSNQSPAINNGGDITWTNYTFACGGGFEDWTSRIMHYQDQVTEPLPAVADTPQGVAMDNIGRVAWGSFHLLELWEAGVTTSLADGHAPALNDQGDVVYTFKDDVTPWQVMLVRQGKTIRISNDVDIVDEFDNIRPAINEHGELAWWWTPNGGLSPSGMRMMRRVRDGDVDFDGDVDVDDFAGMPGCFTGPVPTDGLCDCRFFDIDHDRDIDFTDLEFFLRRYSGPQEDCNGNTTSDLEELLLGSATDCNVNGRIDSCDLVDFPELDSDGDGIMDACCSPSAPAADMIGDQVSIKNRYLSFTTQSNQRQAVRLTFVNLPGPFQALEGKSMWVGEPQEVSENGSSVEPIPGFDNFWAATLSCSPHYTDWAALGTVHVYHEGIIPQSTYELQLINEGCAAKSEFNYSPALTITNPKWGDTLENCQSLPCAPPDGQINIVDIVAIVGRFISAQDSIHKSRADLEPSPPDLQVNITDVLAGLKGFQGLNYPFALSDPNPCGP